MPDKKTTRPKKTKVSSKGMPFAEGLSDAFVTQTIDFCKQVAHYFASLHGLSYEEAEDVGSVTAEYLLKANVFARFNPVCSSWGRYCTQAVYNRFKSVMKANQKRREREGEYMGDGVYHKPNGETYVLWEPTAGEDAT